MGELLSMGSSELRARTESLWRESAYVQELSAHVADVLRAEVPRAIDKHSRNALLEVRRSIFNRRRPSPQAVERIIETIGLDARRELEKAIDGLAELDRRRQDLLGLYETAAVDARARFREIIANPDFRRGLVLSSESLAGNLTRYQSQDASLGRSRRDQIERGLLRYYTRMAAKATPFGTFCSVVGARIVEPDTTHHPPVEFNRSPARKRPALRLNKRIYGHLWERLMRNPAVRRRLVAQVNPSLVRESDRIVFLTGAGGFETFNRVPQNDAIDLLLEIAERRSGATYGDLVDALSDDERLDASEEEAVEFLDQVLDLGLLRLNPVVPEQEADWHEPLTAFLKTIEAPDLDPIRGFLLELGSLLDRFGSASPDDRISILRRMRQQIREGEGLLAGIPWGGHEVPVYEDCGSDATLVLNMSGPVAATLDRLGEWVKLTLPLAGARREMAAMRYFFDRRFGSHEGASVPLLTFYEIFYREHFKAYLESVRTAKPGSVEEGLNRNPFKLASVARVHNAIFRLSEFVRQAWAADPSATQIELTRDVLEHTVGDANDGDYVSGRSASVFGEMFEAGDGCRFVVHGGQYYLGFGKYFSRFLYLVPPEWEAETVRENAKYEAGQLAEVMGEASFNANLHPPLLPSEISYPTAAAGTNAGSERTLCSDLVVERDESNRAALTLRHKLTGRRVIPLDMGFMNPTMRPPLFQLLSRFSPGGYFVFPMPPQLERDAASEGVPTVLHRPRVVYEGCVVLSRRAWFASCGAAPTWKSGENAAELFLRVNDWRLANEIPTRVYVKVWPRSDTGDRSAIGAASNAAGESSDDDAGTIEDQSTPHEIGNRQDAQPKKATTGADTTVRNGRVSRDYHKPQFIDFANPLLVEMFARIAGSLRNYVVVVEECLPEEDQLARYGDEAFHTELVCQLGFDKQESLAER